MGTAHETRIVAGKGVAVGTDICAGTRASIAASEFEAGPVPQVFFAATETT